MQNNKGTKLSNFLFDQIGEFLKTNEVKNSEMILTLSTMLLTLIGTLRTTKEVKLEMIDKQFQAIRHAIEATEDKTHQ
jgi:hypothetical protein